MLIENSSTDNTLFNSIEFREKSKLDIDIIQNSQNYNLGGSLKIGFQECLRQGADAVVVLHGDDQANFSDLRSFMDETPAELFPDVVIGARFNQGSKLIGYSRFRKIGNKTMNTVTSFLFKTRVEDMIAGLNFYSSSFLRTMPFRKFPDDLTFDSNILLWALLTKTKIKFIPITWRDEDQVSNAKVLDQAKRILINQIKVRINGKKELLKDHSHRGETYEFSFKVLKSDAN